MINTVANIKTAKLKLESAKGIPFVIKVNHGRNRIETVVGEIENAYSSIFTVKTTKGELLSFNYADLYSGNICFVKKHLV